LCSTYTTSSVCFYFTSSEAYINFVCIRNRSSLSGEILHFLVTELYQVPMFHHCRMLLVKKQSSAHVVLWLNVSEQVSYLLSFVCTVIMVIKKQSSRVEDELRTCIAYFLSNSAWKQCTGIHS